MGCDDDSDIKSMYFLLRFTTLRNKDTYLFYEVQYKRACFLKDKFYFLSVSFWSTITFYFIFGGWDA